MFDVEFMTYARVAHGAAQRELGLRNTTDGVSRFLSDHIAALRELTNKRDVPAGRLSDQAAKALFRDLRHGSEAEFLTAAYDLTKRLISLMDGRTLPGLLVCLRARSDSELVAGVLKLEIVAEHAAVLERLDSGEDVLAAATNMMDKPGDLKKGALTSSELPDDRVVVGDQLRRAAEYFPKAFGIQLFSSPAEGTRELVGALQSVVPEAVPDVMRTLPTLEVSTAPEALEQLGSAVPVITATVRDEVGKQLEAHRRQVAEIDPKAKFREVVKAGSITVSGPAEVVGEAVTITELPDGRWRTEIVTDVKPNISLR